MYNAFWRLALFVWAQSFSVKTFDRSRNGCQVIREGPGNDFRGPSVQALPLPSRVSFSRARFSLCPLLASACYAGYLSPIPLPFSCHSFKFLWRKVNSKPPTIPFGVVACTLSDNLSRNSCMLITLGPWAYGQWSLLASSLREASPKRTRERVVTEERRACN